MADAREEGSKPKIKRNWSEHPTLRFLMVTFLLFGLYWSYGYLTSPSKITGRLHAQLGKIPPRSTSRSRRYFRPRNFIFRSTRIWAACGASGKKPPPCTR